MLVLGEELLSVVGLLVVLTYNHQFCQVIPPSPSASPRGRSDAPALARPSPLSARSARGRRGDAAGSRSRARAVNHRLTRINFVLKAKATSSLPNSSRSTCCRYSSQHHQAATTALERFCARRFRDSFFGLLLSSSSSDLRTFWSFSDSTISMWQGLDMYGLVRPWAR